MQIEVTIAVTDRRVAGDRRIVHARIEQAVVDPLITRNELANQISECVLETHARVDLQLTQRERINAEFERGVSSE